MADRTGPATGYDLDTRYEDLLAVLRDAVRPEPFALVAYSCAGMLAFRYAADHPGRVSHLILLSGQYAESVPQPFEEKVAPVIRGDFDGYRRRLFSRILPEPHSLKGVEDCTAWAGETTPEVLVESLRAIDGVQRPRSAAAVSPCRRSCSTAPRTRSSPTRTRKSWSRRSPARAW